LTTINEYPGEDAVRPIVALCLTVLASCASDHTQGLSIVGDGKTAGAALIVDGLRMGRLTSHSKISATVADSVYIAPGYPHIVYYIDSKPLTLAEGPHDVIVVSTRADSLRARIVVGEYAVLYVSMEWKRAWGESE
jgi:hypothetical protein